MIQSVIGSTRRSRLVNAAGSATDQGRHHSDAHRHSLKRSNAVPDVPTMTEAGYPGQEGDTPQGMLVPAGTPQPIVDFLYRELMKVMQTEDVKQKLGTPVLRSSPTRSRVRHSHQGGRREVGKVVKDAGIKLE